MAVEALEIARRREDNWMFPYPFSRLAAVAVERCELQRGATLIGAAETMMEAQGAAWPPDERPQYEQTLAKLADTMSAVEFDRARARGRSVTTEEVVQLALADAPAN